MKSSKFQHPTSREDPITQHQKRNLAHQWTLRFGTCLVLGCWCLALSARAQYSIDWYTIDGGGGTSTGSVYSVSGTIGQLDAGGPLTSGQFSVTGGFWALPTAVQTPRAPLLSI